MVERTEGWRLSCEFNTDLYERRTVAGLLARFVVLLADALAAPDTRIADLQLLTPDDHAELTRLRALPRTELAGETVLDMFADQVARTPNAVAVACGGASLTYDALDLRSTQLARELRVTAGPGARVGIFLERSIDAIVAMLAVVKSGNAYVALDPALERTMEVIPGTDLSAIVTRSAYAEQLAVTGLPLMFLNAAPAGHQDHGELTPVSSDDVASVMERCSTSSRPSASVRALPIVIRCWPLRRLPMTSRPSTCSFRLPSAPSW